ncbi:MAG: RidA family protein [Atribacterota bacterium]|nr:RidA family protein [Atribacterota bacterium]MDD4895167.1 RidA family protein [Atribacterota bacterium]MDD5637184.1 RidA family protein [Atribacterota bacterium]
MSRKIINTKKAPSAIGPYSQAIKFNNLVFVSGQIAINPDSNEFVNGNITSQTKQVIENIKAILEAAGSSLQNVLKVTIFITDMKDFDSINKIYSEYFNTSLPARVCVEVPNLPKGAKIEMEAIAIC